MSQPGQYETPAGTRGLRRADPEPVQPTEPVEHEPAVPVGTDRDGAGDVPARPVRRPTAPPGAAAAAGRRRRPSAATSPARAGRRRRAGHGRVDAYPMLTRRRHGDRGPGGRESRRMWRGIRLTDGIVELRRPAPDRRARALRGRPRVAARAPARGWRGRTRSTRRWSRRSGSAAAARAFAEGLEFQFVARAVDSGEVLGTIGLNAMDRLNRWANLGYWLRSDRVGRGPRRPGPRTLVTGFGFSRARARPDRGPRRGRQPSQPGRGRAARRAARGRAAPAAARRRRRPGRRGLLAHPVIGRSPGIGIRDR